MKKIHYAWVVCGMCLLMMMCNMGLCSNIFAVYLPFIESTGISGSAGSAIITVRCITSFVSTFFVSAYYRKVPLKTGAIIATATGVLSAFVFSIGGSIWIYYLAASLAGIAYGLGTVIPVSVLMSSWFDKHRGLALGISSTGTGIGTIIFAPLITSLALNKGLRAAYLVQMSFMLVCLLAIVLLLREKPEDRNLRKYGEGENAEKSAPEESGEFEIPKYAWVLLAVMMLCSGGAGQATSGHVSVLARTAGYSAKTAGLAVTVYGFALIAGKFSYGEIADVIKAKKASTVFMLGFALTCILSLSLNGETLLLCVLFAFLLGFCSAFFNVGIPLWASDLSSPGSYKNTLKWFQLFYSAGGIVFTSIPGRIADRTGEYKSSYILMAAVIMISLAILRWSYKKRSQIG